MQLARVNGHKAAGVATFVMTIRQQKAHSDKRQGVMIAMTKN
jgi:hypothetical protein